MIHDLLDTSVVSELREPKPHGAVVAWLESLREDQIYISAVTKGELQRGVEALEGRTRTKLEKSQSGSTKWKLQATCSPWTQLAFANGPGLGHAGPSIFLKKMPGLPLLRVFID